MELQVGERVVAAVYVEGQTFIFTDYGSVFEMIVDHVTRSISFSHIVMGTVQ